MIGKKIIYGCEERGDAGIPYLTRYTLVSTRWFQLCVHVFHRSDADDLHDHPWNFWTLIVAGGYRERVSDIHMPHSSRLLSHKPGALLYRPAEHLHRVILYPQYEVLENGLVKHERQAVTLVLMTKRRREWGFVSKGKWTNWIAYFKAKGC